MTGKKILITGATGLVGRGLTHVLARDNEVHALARFTKPAMRDELAPKCARIWAKDVAADSCDDLPKDFDVIFHLAVSWIGDDDAAQQENSFRISCDFVADLMYRNDRAAFVLASTGSVYRRSNHPVREDGTPLAGGHSYVTTKIAMSRLARWISTRFGRSVVEMRYWYPFAPYRQHAKIDGFLMGQIVGDDPDTIHQRTYIKTLLEKTIAAVAHAGSPPLVINCASTENLTQRQIAQIGLRVSGLPYRQPTPMPSFVDAVGPTADTSKMVQLLGPETVGLEQGLQRYLRARQQKIDWPEDWMFE